jgi:hypothetical protein
VTRRDVVDLDRVSHNAGWQGWPRARHTLAEAVAAAERFTEDEAALATAPPWSQRVDEAVHGMDAVDRAGMDAWMQAHAESTKPEIHEAYLVAAWETRRDQLAHDADEDVEPAAEAHHDDDADGW